MNVVLPAILIDAVHRILGDLIASTPGEEGKWFATAKTLKQYDPALALARRSPVDPKTLVRAARDHLKSQPAFALDVATGGAVLDGARRGLRVDWRRCCCRWRPRRG